VENRVILVYDQVVTAERLAISLDPELGARIREVAEATGSSISAWMADAAQRKLKATAARAALAEYEAEFGVIPDAEVERVRRAWHL
jgi:hypothetical protein